MGRRRPWSHEAPRPQTDPTAHVVLEGDDRGGVTVVVAGTPQSHVRLDDPGHLEFGYVRHLALVIGTRRPVEPAPLGVTHVGGAGMTLARWVEHTRPGSPQIVLEPDGALTDLVRRELPLPRSHRIRVRPVDGASGTAALRDASAHAIVLDAYTDGRVPAELLTPAYLGQVARVLRPDGVFLANVATGPEAGAEALPRCVAALGEIPGFAVVAMLGPREVVRSRRPGNVVVAAARDGLDLAALRAAMTREPLPSEVVSTPRRRST